MANIQQDILDDGGLFSRKYIALYVLWVLILVGFIFGVFEDTVASLLPAYYGALAGGYTVYCGVNLGHSITASRMKSEENSDDHSENKDSPSP